MTQRLIALVAATTFGLSTVAQAGPVPLSSGTVIKVSLSGASEQSNWVDQSRSAASAKADAAKPARTASVDPGTPATETLAAAPKASAETTTAPSAEPAVKPSAKPAATVAAPAKQPTYRTAKYTGGEGASWKTGRNAYGFSGTFGGCRFTGFAGPNGYRLDRAC